MTLELRVSTIPGSHVHQAAEDAIELATKLQCRIITDFNGTVLIIQPGDIASEIVARYQRAR